MKKSGASAILSLACLSCSALLAGAASAADAENEGSASAAMTMHHMHALINHAVEMAAEGSNLVMLGQMGMAEGVDAASIQHGKAMIDDAESLLTETMSGAAMKDLHASGHGKAPDMTYTHQLGDAAKAYIQLVKKMPAAPAPDHP